MRRGLAAVVLVAVGTAAFPQPAAARPPERVKVDGYLAFVSHTCGFRVEAEEEYVGRATLFFHRGKVVRVESHYHYRGVWRNRRTGVRLIENERFNTTFHLTSGSERQVGVSWHVKLPSGRTVVMDAGKLVFDKNGNVVVKAGRHDVVGHGIRAFCPFLR